MSGRIHTPTDREIIDAARKALQELNSLIIRSAGEATCFLGVQARATRPSVKTLRKIEMDTNLAEKMRTATLGPLSKAPDWLANNLLQPFDQRSTQEEDVRCLVVAQTPAVQEWISALPHRDTWQVFSREDWKKKKILGVFTVIIFPDNAEPLIAFACWSESLLLKRKGWVAVLTNSRYSIEESDSLIYLPPSVDFFFYKGVMFALKWKNFESAVNFRDISRNRATDLWRIFNQAIPIADSTAVWDIVGKSVRTQNTIIKALSNTGRSRPTLDSIEAFIRERGLKVRVEDGALHIDPTDKAQVDELILIMADGFVTSDLTAQRLITYDAMPAC